MRRFYGFLLATVILLLQAAPASAHNASGLPPGAPPQMPEVQGVKVSLGRFVPGTPSVIHNLNFPNVVYVTEGETVTFVNEGGPPHTATFLGGRNPAELTEADLMAPTRPSGSGYSGGFFSTGVLEMGHSFTLTFESAGVYEYFCALHPTMTGTVVVLPKGAPVPAAEQQKVADAKHFGHHHGEVAKAADESAQKPAPRSRNADGSTTWTVQMGASAGGADTMAFYPGFLRIREGDTVEFRLNTVLELHSASVGRPADWLLFGDGPGGLNPTLFRPAGDGIVDGKDEFDGTGLIFPGAPSGKLTFTRAGTYHVHCDLHDFMGMAMVIEVAPRESVQVEVNGERLDAQIQVKEGVVYAPVRALATLLGGTVSFDSATLTARVQVGQEDCGCGTGRARLNGADLDAGYSQKAYIENGTLYAPAAAWAAILGGTAQFDSDNGLLSLTIPNR